ncbi:hypothetical protein HRO20_001457 [Vibrio cholerae]|nr:hypothetical protein [Vibrio cholerae]EHK7541150.1 hypothetical protein [Vibrio cholerae]EJL6689681.1 hypothetical protein [Vibrio cholerae]EJX1707988.1 hypothetical protein [Vibrio cholerae]EKF9834845.1 hypothetical protein [Vibrio cholerae]
MMRQYQQGVATLLITSILLSVALVVTLGSYKNLFYQIKRAQNEVKARQEHWLAEGGLECVYSLAKLANKLENVQVSDINSYCKSPLALSDLTLDTVSGKIKSKPNDQYNTELTKIISNYSTSSSSGAMKSTANLFFRTSMSFYTPDPGVEKEDGFECTIIRHKGSLNSIGPMDNKGLKDGKPPSSDFSSSKNCLWTHRSHWGDKDIVPDPDLKPFEEFFGVKEENHDQVRSKFDYRIAGGGVNCGQGVREKILEHQEANRGGKVTIWVDGHCEIADPYILDIAIESQKTDGLLLLVHEGIFSMNSSPEKDQSSPDIKGLVFHFNDQYDVSESHWDGMVNKANLFHSVHDFDLKDRKKTSFYHHGSISLTGGLYIDDDKNNAMFNNSMAFHFNSDVINNLQSSFVSELKWQEGSWNAQ